MINKGVITVFLTTIFTSGLVFGVIRDLPQPEGDSNIIVRVVGPIEAPKAETEEPPPQPKSCAELDLSDSDVSTHVQESWIATTQSIEINGFSIDQLKSALAAVIKEAAVSAGQERAKEIFIKRVQHPVMLVSGDSSIAVAFRHNLRARLLNVSANLEKQLRSGDSPFIDNELIAAFDAVNEKQSEIDGLMKFDAGKAMAESRALGLQDLQTILRNTLVLIKDIGPDSRATRKQRLAELLRALSKSNVVMEAKCRVWETLR